MQNNIAGVIGPGNQVSFGDKVKAQLSKVKDRFLKKDLFMASLEKAAKEALIAPTQYDNVFSRRAVALDREIPNMMADAVISSSVSLLMETAFQVNPSQKLFRTRSKYDVIARELDAWHDKLDIDVFVLTMAFNLLLYGNLPIKMWYNSRSELERASFEPDYSAVLPIIVSNQTLGFIKEGIFYEPYEYVYAQLMYYRDLGGTRSRYASKIGDSQNGVFNEFTYAPSYLSAAYKPYKNIKIIEDALLLARLDQSNFKRFIMVNVGDNVTSKNADTLYSFYRALIKEARRVSFDSDGLMQNVGNGSEFEIILPTSTRQNVEVKDIGGGVEIKAIKDLEQMYKRLFASLSVQPSQIGFSSEGDGSGGIPAESQFTVPEKRWARKSRSLVASVVNALEKLDYFYLRSHNYAVRKGDWDYSFTAASTLEDQEKRMALKSAVETIGTLGESLKGLGVGFDAKYLATQMLSDALANSSVDVVKLFDVPLNLQVQGNSEGLTGAMPEAGADGGGAPMGPDMLQASKWAEGLHNESVEILGQLGILGSEDVSSLEIHDSERQLIQSSMSYEDFVSAPDIADSIDTMVNIGSELVSLEGKDFVEIDSSDSYPLNRMKMCSSVDSVRASDLLRGGMAPIRELYLLKNGRGFYLQGDDLINYLYCRDSGVSEMPIEKVYREV